MVAIVHVCGRARLFISVLCVRACLFQLCVYSFQLLDFANLHVLPMFINDVFVDGELLNVICVLVNVLTKLPFLFSCWRLFSFGVFMHTRYLIGKNNFM